MIKSREPNGKASVIFTLPGAVGARQVAICGDWNDWSPDADVMHVVEDGFSLDVVLDVGRTYRFRYLIDGERWENDWNADSYLPNTFGSEDSVVDLTRPVEADSPSPPEAGLHAAGEASGEPAGEPRVDAKGTTAGPVARFAAAVVRICVPPSTTKPKT
jgi:hypothetical protein